MPSNFGHREARAAKHLDLAKQGRVVSDFASYSLEALRADATLFGPWQNSNPLVLIACEPCNTIGSLVSVRASSQVFVTAHG